MNAAQAVATLRAVLCDHDGKCCIAGSVEDRRQVDLAIAALSAREGGEAVAWGVTVNGVLHGAFMREIDAESEAEVYGTGVEVDILPLIYGLHPAQPASQQGAIGEIVARPYGYGVEWLVSPAPVIGTKLYASQQTHPAADKVLVTDGMVEAAYDAQFTFGYSVETRNREEVREMLAAALSPPANGENDGS